MGFNFPNARDSRQLREAADRHAQVQRFYDQAQYYDVRDLLEGQRRIEKDLQLQRGEALRDLQGAVQLHETLLANQLDLREAAQVALDQRALMRDALGNNEAFEAAITLAEQHSRASLDAARVAQITEQLDAEYFARTLRRAQELSSESTLESKLGQADIHAIIREAEDAMDAALWEPGEFPGEITVGPPEWMRRLPREKRLVLIELLVLYVETFLACFGAGVVLSDGNISDTEVQAVGQALLTMLHWALYLERRKNDN